MKQETKVFMFGFLTLLSIMLAAILVVIFAKDDSTGGSPKFSPKPGTQGSPIRIGYKPRFTSKQLIQSSAPNVTFNFVANPLTDGSAGYLTYNNNSNMLSWPVDLPLNFTHARFDGNDKIFLFRNPNSSDTYGSFVDGSIPGNFFSRTLDLGVYF